MIIIIDYKLGNVLNAYNYFKKLDSNIKISSNKDEILNAKIVILPGVGAFEDAMNLLKEKEIDKILKIRARNNMPIIGICLGMQVLFESSYENGYFEGLKILKGSFKKFNSNKLRIPHMGWNNLIINKKNSFLKNLDNKYAYFVHSYYLTNYDDDYMLMYSEYIDKVPAIIKKGNIIAMQFHPEKSSTTGDIILENFRSELYDYLSSN